MSETVVTEARDSRGWRVGMVIGGKYALLSLRGEGGEGPLFEAQNTWTGRRVAIKLLHPEYRESEHHTKRLIEQARTVTQLEHPNIVDVLDIGQDHNDGSFFIVQEFLRGHDLRKLIDRGALEPARAIDLLVPVMVAIIAIHDHDIIHRDIKPENIFLAHNALGAFVPKLIDFGVARTSSGMTDTVAANERAVGTVEYMAPEQARGEKLDARADVWSMGVVLYEMIAWRRPFDGSDDKSSLSRLLSIDVPRLDTCSPAESDLADAIARALERDPDKRWRSMRDFLDALLACKSIAGDEIRERHKVSLASIQPGVAHGSVSVTMRAVTPDEAPRPEAPSRVITATSMESLASDAERALQTNALDEAVSHAENAIRRTAGAEEITGRMRLVQAIAHRWRGRHPDAARSAFEAFELLPRGSCAWFDAAAELAVASGLIGQRDRLGGLSDAVLSTEPRADDPRSAGGRVVAAYRIATWLLRTGHPERADAVCAAVAEATVALSSKEHSVAGWHSVYRAENASHDGDPGASIGHLQGAIDAFARAGDARNACVQRQNLANMYIQLGGYEEADGVLSEVLAAANAMQLEMAAVVKANHAVVLARRGDVVAAAATAREAIDELVARGNRRAEAFSRIYLAGILSFQKDWGAAEEEARAAIAAASSAPEARAYAFATLGALLLRQRKSEEALEVAERAMEILRSLGGVSEGESLIRLVYAVALRANHRASAAETALDEAIARLHERAQQISEERWRKSFLENIAENASTLARRAPRAASESS
jgi:serine/threonine protein kinase